MSKIKLSSAQRRIRDTFVSRIRRHFPRFVVADGHPLELLSENVFFIHVVTRCRFFINVNGEILQEPHKILNALNQEVADALERNVVLTIASITKGVTTTVTKDEQPAYAVINGPSSSPLSVSNTPEDEPKPANWGQW